MPPATCRLASRLPPPLLLICVTLVAATSAPSGRMDVARAMKVMEQESLELKNLRAEIERAKARRSQTVSLAGPTLSIRGSSTEFEGSFSAFSGGFSAGNLGSFGFSPAQTLPSLSTGSQRSDTLSGSLSYILFSSGKVENFRKGAGADLQRVRLNYEKRKNELMLEVQKEFYLVLQTGHQEEVARAAVARLIELQKITESLVRVGNAPKVDQLRVETDLANGRVQQIQAENLHQIAISSFLTLLNLPQGSEFEWGEPEVERLEVKEGLPALIETALQRRPEVEMGRLGIAGAQAYVRAERADDLPFLTLGSAYALLNSPTFSESHSWSISANLSWTLFDAGLNAAQVRERRQVANQARIGLEQARRGVELDVTQAYLNLKAAEAAFEAAKKGTVSADESLRISKLRYQSGYGTQLEVLDAEAADSRAQSTYYQSEYAYLTAIASYKKALGIPLYDPDS